MPTLRQAPRNKRDKQGDRLRVCISTGQKPALGIYE
jgi:hypothetical protein